MTDKNYNIKQYNRRWVNLFLFVIFAINNGVHWGQYSVINEDIAEYYSVSHAYVEWTSGLYTLSYVIFVAPGLYAMEKINMRYLMIIVSFLSTIGSWMKVFSVVPDRFLLAFVAQIIITTSYSFTFGGSARLIASWFGVHESSRASAMSLFGDQCGGAISFLIPIIMVHKSPDKSDITVWENSLRTMHIANASMSTLFLALIILLFKNKPKNPPSMVQALKKEEKAETFTQALPKMMKNRAFLMLLFWYTMVGGLMNIMGAVVGELITHNFSDTGKAGAIGFTIAAFGMFSSPVFGYIMDKTHRFKEVGIALATGSFISFALFTLVLKMENITLLYLISVALGTFMTSTYVNGIQIGIEILYPISEDQCSAVMVFSMQLFATIILPIYSALLGTFGDITANLLFCILTFVGLVVSFLTPVQLNRQEAELKSKARELKEFLPNSIPPIVKR